MTDDSAPENAKDDAALNELHDTIRDLQRRHEGLIEMLSNPTEAEPRPRLFITHSGDHLKPAFTSLREHDRTVMLFSMKDGDKEICCAVSSSAMDDLERGAKAKPDQHDDQFLRLRERIKQRAV